MGAKAAHPSLLSPLEEEEKRARLCMDGGTHGQQRPALASAAADRLGGRWAGSYCAGHHRAAGVAFQEAPYA